MPLLDLSIGRRGCRRPTVRNKWARPSVEPLETKDLLSVLTVTNNNDAGANSLRDTIAAAASGATIVFDPSLTGQTITLTSGQLDVTKNLSIQWLGTGALTVSGNDASRVFHIAGGVKVTLFGLTISHGKSSRGAGIDNAGKLTLQDCTVQSCQANPVATTDLGGGGILNEAHAQLTMSNSLVSTNTASAASGMDVFGGGLLNLGKAAISFTTFQNNQATGGSGTTFFGGSVGGGIDNFGGASLSVSNSQFASNQAVGAVGFFGIGGALENNAGADLKHPSTAHITNCIFTDNLATGGDGSSGNGGALDNEGTGATMTLTGSTLTSNKAVGGANANGTSTLGEGLGGGIVNGFKGKLTVTSCLFTDNQAIGGDHSTPTTTQPSTGAGAGGALVNGVGTATVSSSSFNNNLAQGGLTNAGPGGLAEGGAIENWGKLLFPGASPGILHVISCSFQGNRAAAGTGGPGTNSVLSGQAFGGAIDSSFGGVAVVTGSTLAGNSTTGSNGGAGVTGGQAVGGAISVGNNALVGFSDQATLQVINCSLFGNLAQGGTGGTGSNGGDAHGGGIAVSKGSTATVTASTILFNRAIGGTGGAGGSSGSGVGGGVHHVGTFTSLLTVISSNVASTSNNDVFP
jgi:hypothetical protein